MINDILIYIKLPIQGFLFADDSRLTCSAKLTTNIELLQKSINDLLTWSEKSGLNFLLKNQNTLYFLRKQIQNPPKLYKQKTEIEKVDNIEILGLIFDNKLTWMPHMQYLKCICTKKMNIIKVLAELGS